MVFRDSLTNDTAYKDLGDRFLCRYNHVILSPFHLSSWGSAGCRVSAKYSVCKSSKREPINLGPPQAGGTWRNALLVSRQGHLWLNVIPDIPMDVRSVATSTNAARLTQTRLRVLTNDDKNNDNDNNNQRDFAFSHRITLQLTTITTTLQSSFQ